MKKNKTVAIKEANHSYCWDYFTSAVATVETTWIVENLGEQLYAAFNVEISLVISISMVETEALNLWLRKLHDIFSSCNFYVSL